MDTLNVLVLADHADDVALVRCALEQTGRAVAVRSADNESDFFEALASPETRPDLIIADDGTRALPGLQSLRLLRSWGEEIPYLLLTSFAREELGQRALALGAADYLIKDRVARLGHAALRALELHALRHGPVQRPDRRPG